MPGIEAPARRDVAPEDDPVERGIWRTARGAARGAAMHSRLRVRRRQRGVQPRRVRSGKKRS